MIDKKLKEIASKSLENMVVDIYNQAVDDIANAIMKKPDYRDQKMRDMKHYFSDFVREQKL